MQWSLEIKYGYNNPIDHDLCWEIEEHVSKNFKEKSFIKY